MAIPPRFINELLARTDMVEIVGRYVPLRKGGANFMGLCPFHNEKSPSFSVNPVKQFFHCFGCGKSGNAINFLMEHVGMTFVEAVKDLAQQYGMQVPEEEVSPEDRARVAAQREKQITLNDVLEKAAQSYQSRLKESPRAIAYLKGRGLSGQIAKQFGLGYAPVGWNNLASVFPHYDDPLLVESGLIIVGEEDSDKRYDRFRDRVMFPIRNVKGECIGFGGRVLGDDKPKYLNSPETPVFSKGRELYGLFEARNAIREQGYALVTEGYMDVVALAQWGFPNTVATLGTACTADHIHKLFRFTDKVVFSFDGDSAGQRAAHKALEAALPYATDVRSIKFLFLPTEHDPDSFIRTHGTDAFADYVKQATPLSRFLLEVAQEGCDMDTAEGRAHMMSNAKPLWEALPEGVLKMQVESELSAKAQLQQLPRAWQAPPKQATPRRYIPPPMPSSHQPVSRADHAVRILLGQCQLWDNLSDEYHELLCQLPAPHGDLLAWVEVQLHTHGALPWGSLQEELQKSEIAAEIQHLAQRLMGNWVICTDSDKELRDLLDRMMIDKLKEEENKFLLSDRERYKKLQERRVLLQKRINSNS